MKTELQPGTLVKTKFGNNRVIKERRPTRDSDEYGRAYAFTSGTWDHEAHFTVVSVPARETVILPPAIAAAIEHIRTELDQSEADEILMSAAITGRVPSPKHPQSIRSKTYLLHRFISSTMDKRKDYLEAIIVGYQKDLTPREKLAKGIREGSVSRESANFVLDCLGMKSLPDDDIWGSCAVR